MYGLVDSIWSTRRDMSWLDLAQYCAALWLFEAVADAELDDGAGNKDADS